MGDINLFPENGQVVKLTPDAFSLENELFIKDEEKIKGTNKEKCNIEGENQ